MRESVRERGPELHKRSESFCTKSRVGEERKVTCGASKKCRCAGRPGVSAGRIQKETHGKVLVNITCTCMQLMIFGLNFCDRNLPRSCCDVSDGTCSRRSTPQVPQETQVSFNNALLL